MTLHGHLHDHADEILRDATASLRIAGSGTREGAEEGHTHQRLKALLTLTVRGVKERNLGPMIAHAETMADERFRAGMELRDLQTAFNVLEEVLWQRILRFMPRERHAEALGLVSTVLAAGKEALARAYLSRAGAAQTPPLNLEKLFTGGG